MNKKLFKFKFKCWFLDKFGERCQEQRDEGYGNIGMRRGWEWRGKIYWYDEDWN